MSSDFPQKRSIRLQNYDYSQDGLYFVTICTKGREEMFGKIENGKMAMNEVGKIIDNILLSLPIHHSVKLGKKQIMPNHVHAILILDSKCRGGARTARYQIKNKDDTKKDESGFARKTPTKIQNLPITGSLSCIIRSFKSECSKQIRKFPEFRYRKIFQRNYYEHIIRNETEYFQIKNYIKTNPENWLTDKNNINPNNPI